MSELKFPLCKEAGITVTEICGRLTGNIYAANPFEVEALLAKQKAEIEQAPVAYVLRTNDGVFHACSEEVQGQTHTARLTGITPIKQESEDRKLLRELAEYLGNIEGNTKLRTIVERAKRLLEKGE